MQPIKALDYFYKEVTLLKMLGISLTGNESVFYTVYSVFILTVTTVLHPILVLREIVVQGFENYIDYVVYEFAYILVLAKVVVTYINRIKLGKILSKLHEQPFLPNTDRGGEAELEIIETCKWTTNAQTLVYWSTAIGTIICTVIYTLIIRVTNEDYHKWVMTYGPLTVLNTTYSPNFELTLFYQNFSVLFSTAIFATIDLLIAAVLSHVSFQFKILQNYMQRLVKNNYKKEYDEIAQLTPDIPWNILHNSQIKFIQYHNAILDIAKEMEEAFSPLLLLVYLGTIGVLCFEIYRGSMATDSLQMARTLFEILSFLVQIAIVSYWGEQIIFESKYVANAVLETDFIGTDLKFQKGLVMIIMRSQKPVKLTAGKLIIVELFTFTWVVKTSYSAFMIIKSSQH